MILRERSFDCTFDDMFTTLLGMWCHSVVDCVIFRFCFTCLVFDGSCKENSISRVTWGGQRSVSAEDWYLRSRWTFSRLLKCLSSTGHWKRGVYIQWQEKNQSSCQCKLLYFNHFGQQILLINVQFHSWLLLYAMTGKIQIPLYKYQMVWFLSDILSLVRAITNLCLIAADGQLACGLRHCM